MSYKLMLKIHRKTYKKYLCVTRKDDWEKYKGSGIYWLNHIKIHGNCIKTILLTSSPTRDADFINTCLWYSYKWDIVNSTDFANLIPENGNSSWIGDIKHFSEKSKILSKISSEKYWNSIRGNIQKQINSEQSKKYWADNRNFMISRIKSSWSDEKREKYSNMGYEKYSNMTVDELLEHGKKITVGRNNMTSDAKVARGEKITIAFRESIKRQAFVESMKVTRKGANNPASCIIFWDGVIYGCKSDFEIYLKSIDKTLKYGLNILDKNKTKSRYYIRKTKHKQTTCPHCSKTGGAAGMTRWHFNNCKEKNK